MQARLFLRLVCPTEYSTESGQGAQRGSDRLCFFCLDREGGEKTADIRRKLGVSQATF